MQGGQFRAEPSELGRGQFRCGSACRQRLHSLPKALYPQRARQQPARSERSGRNRPPLPGQSVADLGRIQVEPLREFRHVPRHLVELRLLAQVVQILGSTRYRDSSGRPAGLIGRSRHESIQWQKAEAQLVSSHLVVQEGFRLHSKVGLQAWQPPNG